MFSRDSQIPGDSKLPKGQSQADNKRNGGSNNGSHPASNGINNGAAHNVASNGSSNGNVIEEGPEVFSSEVSSVERSQSWQIAPNLFTSFKYAWAGISYAFRTQRNFRVHTGVGTIAILLCWVLRVSNLEIAVVCLTIGAVLVMEILNTALESLVDLTVGQTYHELAKIAKDCAAGAVLMAAIIALLIAILIFAPPLWALVSVLGA